MKALQLSEQQLTFRSQYVCSIAEKGELSIFKHEMLKSPCSIGKEIEILNFTLQSLHEHLFVTFKHNICTSHNNGTYVQNTVRT